MIHNSDNNERTSQKKLAWAQILFGGTITMGTMLFAVGTALVLAEWSAVANIATTPKLANFFSSLANYFGGLAITYAVIGAFMIVIGFAVPWYKFNYSLRKKSKRLVPKISIRDFSPRTAGDDDKDKKKELRDRILSEINDPKPYVDACRGKLLSLDVCFFLHKEKETGSARDLDNMLKILCDVLPDYVDQAHTEKGLGLITEKKDHVIFEIHCTKELVDYKNQEGMDIEIFEWS